MRPNAGVQSHYNTRHEAKTFRYDASLAPVMQWDGQNPAREQAEALIRRTLEAVTLEDAKTAASELAKLTKPFLNWAGKAERLSFDVPTLPLFVHERLSTKAILETIKGHRFDRNQSTMMDYWGDPQHPVADQALRAYEYQDEWVNRMILGDSLVVMNSLLHLEHLGGQVQMIYLDPPYGVRFGSNFQPFVRKRDVNHNDDEAMTREPEMVQAYRDTWELGLHSYLTYLRDRLVLARELLSVSGSIFVQIGDENVHHVRELMDEVFGSINHCGEIVFQKTSYATADLVPAVTDYLLWYAKDIAQVKFRKLFFSALPSADDLSSWYLEMVGGEVRKVSSQEVANPSLIPAKSRLFQSRDLASAGAGASTFPFRFKGKDYHPGSNRHWKTNADGMKRLAHANRLFASENSLRYKRYAADYPWTEYTNVWTDTIVGSFHEPRIYVVQTSPKVIQRCILMTTDPGDLVVDPTCGSGTTAYVAEQWGRRWITVDTSRVPLALARQRLLTATFPWYTLQDEKRGPAGGFVYRRRQNRKGDEIGGIVPHIMLKTIANEESPEEQVLVDRPEEEASITRVTGRFCFEATIPTPQEFDEKVDQPISSQKPEGAFIPRMLEVLRRSPVLRLEGNKAVTLKNVRTLAKTLSLSAEAIVVNGAEKPVSFLFGPENGAVSEKLVYEAAREAHAKSYSHLYVIGFAIEPNARMLIDKAAAMVGVHATYVQATPDLMMGDLLKNMRSSQIFSVCGLPDIEVRRLKSNGKGNGTAKKYEVELLGLDVFDPIAMVNYTRGGDDVPAWFLDTDYNNVDGCFHVSQAFFPRTGAWENLSKALRTEYDQTVWEHLGGKVSAPFEAGNLGQIAIKVIDDRGNDLMVVKNLSEAK